MPNLYVSESKRQIENISYFGDFRSDLVSGETITSQTVTISVLSGIDPSPSSMLIGGIAIHNGNILEQHIGQGVPGVIYDIVFSIVTSLGNDYNRTTRLAVLPNVTGATPVFNLRYYTSDLYPYEYLESVQSDIYPYYFHLLLNPRWTESIKNAISPVVGSMPIGAIYYKNYQPEKIQPAIAPYRAVLVANSAVPYNNPHEDIKNNIAAISVTLTKGQVFYVNYQPENIKPAIAPQGGTLA